ncbi:MAG: DUF2892 domain-containing protein [Ignavibacteriales bacterium CG_4_9_14_3_um_filter_30_11]|nr:MAG: DUF2892 domain-containing protein [Ignavibacteriales bacterium CG_4_9_14_3_um_filter_30_11]
MEYLIRRIAGLMILASLTLGYFFSPYWLLITAFVGVNLVQSSLTNWCPLETILNKFKK